MTGLFSTRQQTHRSVSVAGVCAVSTTDWHPSLLQYQNHADKVSKKILSGLPICKGRTFDDNDGILSKGLEVASVTKKEKTKGPELTRSEAQPL